MCGIVGTFAADSLAINKESWFKDALYVDGLRGLHSVGVFRVTRVYNEGMVKKAMSVPDFLDLGAVKDLFKYSNKLFIGHNRHATKGKVNNTNAHPFTHGKITMVHNGSLTNHSDLIGGKKFEVDSEAICYSLDKVGPEETIPKLSGAFSLVWYNSEDKTINFIRNDERPMYIAYTKDFKEAVFASEEWMITSLAGRLNNPFQHINPFSTKVGRLYTYKLDEGTKKINTPTTKDIELKKAPTYSYGKWGGNANKRLSGPSSQSNANYAVEQEKLFKGYSLKRDQEIEFTLLEKEKRGVNWVLSGIMNSYPWLPVRVYNVQSDLYSDTDTISGKAIAIRESEMGINKSKEHYCVVSPISLSTVVDVTDLDDFTFDNFAIYEGPGTELLTEKEFNELTKHGCSNCQCNLDVEDHKKIRWLDSRTPLCEDCKSPTLAIDNTNRKVH